MKKFEKIKRWTTILGVVCVFLFASLMVIGSMLPLKSSSFMEECFMIALVFALSGLFIGCAGAGLEKLIHGNWLAKLQEILMSVAFLSIIIAIIFFWQIEGLWGKFIYSVCEHGVIWISGAVGYLLLSVIIMIVNDTYEKRKNKAKETSL